MITMNKTHPQTAQEELPSDIPTIYADGENDDTSGWIACVENNNVIFDGKLYAPNENITIDRDMRFGVNVIALPPGEPVPDDIDVTWVVARAPANSKREISFMEDDENDPLLAAGG